MKALKDDEKIIDELMKDDVVKEAILEFVALEVAAATKNIKANPGFVRSNIKVYEKPKCFGKYFIEDQRKCRSCRFAADCKKKSKKKSK